MIWVVPAVLTLVMGAWGLRRQAWRDEHATWQAATMPWPDLKAHLSHVDIVFAPYYAFMRLWVAVFGDSVVAMRLPSLLAMASAAALVAVLGQRLFDKWVGLAAGCLFAVLPSVSRFAQEARPYPFAIAFAAASMLALLWATSSPRWWRWGLVSLLVALTGFGHLIALLVLVAHLPVVIARKRLGTWVAAAGIGLIPVLPLAFIGARQTGQVSWIDSGIKSLATLPFSLARSAAVAGMIAALAILGVLTQPWDWRRVTLVLWALAPPIILFGLARDLFYYRYLLFVLPAWVMLAALALNRKAAVAVVAAVALLGAPDHLAVRRSPLPGDQDYRAAAAFVAAHMQPQDSISFSGYPDKRERLGFAYELRGRSMPRECAGCAPRLWLVSNGPIRMVDGFEPVETKAFPGIVVTLCQALRPTPQ